MHWLRVALSTVLFASSALSACVAPNAVTGDTSVHDPTICRDNTGKYWVFSTAVGLEIRTSTDRKAWTLVGKVWPNGANWTDPFTLTSNGVLWAPDCTIINGEFWLYYAASSFGSQHSAIFLAKSKTGLPGSWTHEGLVTSTPPPTNDFNAIDPNLLIDGNNWILSFGSFWSGIKSLSLNPTTGLPINQTVTALSTRTANSGAIEASVLFKFKNFYYLFTSWDNCCESTDSTYNIRVGRSTTPTGGFVDKNGRALTAGGGSLVLGPHDSINGPGGQDLLLDRDGPIIVYHYYTPSGNFLGINKLDFSSGWPVVI